jgi:hypothetical protein
MSDAAAPTTTETKPEEVPAAAAAETKEAEAPAAAETKDAAPAAEGHKEAPAAAAAEGQDEASALNEVKVVTNEENEETLFKVYVIHYSERVAARIFPLDTSFAPPPS